MKINKKKLVYVAVGLVGAYFLFPHAGTVVEYVKDKIKSLKKSDTDYCECKQNPCNCKK
jgi:hypothetical protein